MASNRKLDLVTIEKFLGWREPIGERYLVAPSNRDASGRQIAPPVWRDETCQDFWLDERGDYTDCRILTEETEEFYEAAFSPSEELRGTHLVVDRMVRRGYELSASCGLVRGLIQWDVEFHSTLPVCLTCKGRKIVSYRGQGSTLGVAICLAALSSIGYAREDTTGEIVPSVGNDT